mmetsp:Transcript_118589/g.221610  ORF Transcript_118589/g.221610 Transcript_118589/m.221610 type:complete len:485 (+) Transcript_118589:44-1498(+)
MRARRAERGGSRGSSRAGSQASRGSASRAQSAGASVRGDDRKQRSRPRLERSASAPGSPAAYNRSMTPMSMNYRSMTPMSMTSFERGSSRASMAALDDSGKEKRRRAKRSGYNHPAAMQSAPDLLYMPRSVEMEAQKYDPLEQFTPAGVGSDRMAQLLRGTIDSNDKKKRPQPKTDPITHRAEEEDDPFRDGLPMDGVAGVTTHRLAVLERNGVREKANSKNVQFDPPKRTDPISHIGGPPDPITRGIRRFPTGRSKSSVPIFHNTELPTRLAPKKVQGLMKTKVIKAGDGEVIYNVAGEDDLIPAATNAFNKADLPPTAAYKAKNNKQMLPSFYRQTRRAQNPQLETSPDTIRSMYGEHPRFVRSPPAPDWAAMVVAMNGKTIHELTPADRTRVAGFYSARDQRRFSDAGSIGSFGGSQTYREPLSTQRLQSAPSGRSRNLKSADGYARRASADDSYIDPEVESYISGDSRMREVWLSPKGVT